MSSSTPTVGAGLLLPPVVAMAESERDASRDAALAEMPSGDPWVFTYGSLMWDRGVFDFETEETGLLRGYHRRFCIWTQLARGTPEQPGLALGLEPGGACRGVAFRIARDNAEHVFDRIWHREMYTGCYVPRWVRARIVDRDVVAITFVARRDHPQYAGNIVPEMAANYIAHAHGERGPCREYLTNTLDNLSRLSIRDRGMERLRELVDQVQPA